MSNILFITAEFPPIQTTGSRRPLRHIQHLLKLGHHITLLVPDLESCKLLFPSASIDKDFDFKHDNFNLVRIQLENKYLKEKSKLVEFFFHYVIAQDKINKFWSKNVISYCKENFEVGLFDAIYTNSPPFSVALIGVKVKQLLKAKLITDFRDHWLLWGTSPYISYFHYLLVWYYENKVFRNSEKIISVTNQVIDDFKNSHLTIPKSKFICIHNSSNVDINHEIFYNPENKIHIGYIGNFYFNPISHKLKFTPWYKRSLKQILNFTPRLEDYKFRSPYYFFKAIRGLINEYPEVQDKIKITFIGEHPNWLYEMVNEFNIAPLVCILGRKSYEETNTLAEEFDLGLITSLKIVNPKKGKDYCIASKSFDYLRLGIPMLGFVSEGEQKDFIISTNSGFVFNPEDIDYKVFYKTIFTNKSFKIHQGEMYSFQESYISQQLFEIFNQ